MSRFTRLVASLAALSLGVLFAGSAVAAPSASIEQVRNGQASSPTTPIPTWGTGNAGASNSHYLESHSIAYRTVMDGLPTDGTVVEIVIGYDARRSGSYALDYLTHFQRLLPHVTFAHRNPEVFNPLDGVTGVGPEITTAPFPLPTSNVSVDPDGAGPEPAALQPLNSAASLPDSERVVILYGGTVLGVTWETEADMNPATKSSESRVHVRFVPGGPKAVLAWGGHIASRWDWGFNPDGSPRSAGGISGSSYHMRLVGWNLGSLGSQDRSMSTDAVFPVPICAISNLGPFCGGTTNTHTAPVGMESYQWSLFNNTAGAVIVGTDTSTAVVVQTSFPGSYSLMLTTGASGFSKQCSATVNVLAPATADAGLDLESCANSPAVQLSGIVTGGNLSWTGGTGVFNPSRTVANPTYTPSAAEIAAGGVTLTLNAVSSGPCPSASDQVRINVRPVATGNAGADQVVCAGNPQVQLAGVVGGGASSGTWSGGAGTFNPSASALNAVYTPSPAEIAAGGVTLTLTTNDPAGPCGAFADQMHITINPSATANAGADQAVCASAPQVQLTGVLGGGATTGTWSDGTGTFNPNASALNAVYTPSAAEIAAGGVTLTLTTNDPAGPCGAANDQVHVTINPAATTNAGADQTVCSSSPQVQLAAIFGGGASGGSWSGGAGTFTPSAAAPNAVYTPSAGEIAAGGVTLTFTTNDPAGPCGAVSDQMHVTINPAAMANAGADQTVCAASPQVQLAGSIGGSATIGTWSGGAGSFSPKATTLNAIYTPTAAEIAAGHVTLTLTASGTGGPCPPVSDQVTITIDAAEVASAGPDQAVCATSPQVQLQGSVTGAVTTGTWSGGTGTFSPNRNALNATYTPSAAEIAAGHVTLTLTSSTVPGRPCPPASDPVTITIAAPATVNAGPDQIVCAASPQVQLQGSLGGAATSATWSGGAGTFTPNPSALNALYTPTPGEVTAGSVTLTLTTNDPAGPCGPVSDQVKITFDKPTVTVADRVTCSGISPVTLCASPGNGVPPYTYHWSNGATSQCITVSDSLLYTVTVTDAKGCQATGSGRFRPRDCIGQLTHTSATCATFEGGTAQDFSTADINYAISNFTITNIAPGVFFYWSKVTAPASDFTINVVETKSNQLYSFIPIQQATQVTLYDADCNNVGSGSETTPGQASIVVHGATVGQVFIVSVKYSLKDLVGTYGDDNNGCRYDFRTWINGQLVDADPDGITIGNATVTGVGGTPGGRYMRLYRPMPNPFTGFTQMAYEVPQGQQVVSIRVFDVAGRLVRTLADEREPAGVYVVTWNGKDEQGVALRPGMYFVQARIGGEARRVTVTFLK